MKIAVVTGASRGIGLATVKQLVSDGFLVFGGSRTKPSYEDLNFVWHPLDLAQRDSISVFCEFVAKECGSVDVLVNNAGITLDKLTERMSYDDFLSVLTVNVLGLFELTKGFFPLLSEKASLINISSVVGETGNIGQANYAASKAGVIGLSKTWAKELTRKGRRIRVNVVCPGFINSDMTAKVPDELKEKFANQTLLKRFGEVEEVANVIAFLASDKSSYITNAIIDVNGGLAL